MLRSTPLRLQPFQFRDQFLRTTFGNAPVSHKNHSPYNSRHRLTPFLLHRRYQGVEKQFRDSGNHGMPAVADSSLTVRRQFKKAVQQGRSERRTGDVPSGVR